MKNPSIMKHKMKALALFAAVVFSCAAAMGASSPDNRTVELTAGQARTVDLGAPVADILVANPAVADVGTMRSSRLYIVGKTVGDTNILAFDAEGNQLADIAVQVSIDGATIRDTLKRFFPKERVEARTVKNDIVLTGDVSTPAMANQIRDLAGRFTANAGQQLVDLMKVQGDQQVMLKVKVVEAKRAVLREYGFDSDMGPTGAGLANGGVLSMTGGQTGLINPTAFATGTIAVTDAAASVIFRSSLSALERDGLINTLAEPNLTAISGETAGFLAGGEYPVPTGRDSNGNITLEFKQFGVALNFTPTVLASDRISMQLSAEVSAKTTSAADGLSIAGTVIPGLTTRRAETTVQLGSGGTLMIAGLIKSEDAHTFNGLPGIQNLPIIGELFRSQSFARDETELVFLVTPYLVSPYAEPEAIEVSQQGALPVTAPPLSKDPQKRTEAVPVEPVSETEIEEIPENAGLTLPFFGAKEAAAIAPAAGASRMAGVKAAPKPPKTTLAQSFASNLRRIYGKRVPQDMAQGAAFGYIVD